MTINKLPEWRKVLNTAVENYQSTQSWYEENRDSPAALDDMERAEDHLTKFVRECGFRIDLDLLDEIDELQEHRAAVEDKHLLGVIDALEHPAGINAAGKQVVRRALVELQERRKADNAEPVADVVVWSSPNEERICDIRWRRFDVAPGPLYAVPPKPASNNL